MVVWANYLQNVADFLATTTQQAGIISSLIWVVFAIYVTSVTSKGKGTTNNIVVISFFSILLFTFMGWFPTWTGSVIALVLAIYLGNTFSDLTGR